MSTDVQAAWVAALASIAVAGLSLLGSAWANFTAGRTQRDADATARALEDLKAGLADQNDAAKARRDYEYEARKRLYQELYPLAFQLQEAALSARHRIMNLARASRDGNLAPGANNWLTSANPYYFTSVVHGLIAPLAIYELMSRKLTLLDLSLDDDLRCQYFIAGQAYEALRSDYNLAQPPYPPIAFGVGEGAYEPPEDRPDALPPEPDQRWAWRQGLYSGQIGQAVAIMLRVDGPTTRVMTFAEFVNALAGLDLRTDDDPAAAGTVAGNMKTVLRPMSDLVSGFHPARRPVTWRILMAQAACYRTLALAKGGNLAPQALLHASTIAAAGDPADFDWIGDGQASIPPALRDKVDFAAEQKAALAAGDLFIEIAFKGYARG
jgi:hypothetical protein